MGLASSRVVLCVIMACALGACGPSPKDAGITLTVVVPVNSADQLEISLMDGGRSVLEEPAFRPEDADEFLSETQVISVILRDVPANQNITVKVRSLNDGFEVHSFHRGVVALKKGKFVPLEIDLDAPSQACVSDDICNGDDADDDCDDLINEGCCDYEENWSYESVDSVSSGEQASIALLNELQPRVVYRDSNDLRYAERNNGKWKVTRMKTPEVVDGILPKLDFDSAGNPHIMSFETNPEKKLLHRFRDPSGDFMSNAWGGSLSPQTSFGFGISRNPIQDILHVVFIGNALNEMYSQRADANDNVPDMPVRFAFNHDIDGKSVSIGVSASGVPHAVIIDESDEVNDSRYDDTKWPQPNLTLGSYTAVNISSAARSDDVADFVFYAANPENEQLIFVRKDESDGWDDETSSALPIGSKRGQNPSIALDPDLADHILFESPLPGSQKNVDYLCRDKNNEWRDEAEIVREGAVTVSDRAIAVDKLYCVHVVYQLQSGGIEYAKRCPRSPVPEEN